MNEKLIRMILNTYKTVLLMLLMLMCWLLLPGCHKGKSSSQIKKYVISHYFGTDEDAREYVDTLSQEGIFEKVFINQTPRIEIWATDAQAEKWVQRHSEELEELSKQVSQNRDYLLDIDDEQACIRIISANAASIPEITETLMLAIFHEEMMQIFSGNSDWQVQVIIQKSEKGEELWNSVYPGQDIDLTENMWG